ncbi:ribosomal protein S12 methylthiotransferase [Halomonas campaniensis]|uniref:Ribosomal protein S12 methylthiotransferase n=1 Tax=Halomonas campaniensis TaxID=213554 RepID=A0A7W5K696_9GAMM|nr:ribosomal protein S12 methylthiotransferase [Halomonas campaniensis]
MSTPKVGFVSLGCPKALVDSERILTQLRAEGYEITPSYDDADVVVVNTCGFIDSAKAESLDAIGEAIAENGRVIVTGCMGVEEGAIRDVHPSVLAVTGPQQYEQVVGAVHEVVPPRREHDPHIDLVPAQGVKLTPRHYAYLKISEGCNHSCSFCIIPSMRGKLVSRPVGEVLSEAEGLKRAGVKELLVISQDTSAYGVDLKYRTGFWNGRPVKTRMTELCEALSELGIWVRLHYVYPYPHVDELIPLMAEGKLLPYLDIPFQHASPMVLKAMKRPAFEDRTLERIKRWRALCPELTIRSTFIVGFPGETEEDFQTLLDWLTEAQLDRVGCFQYSPWTAHRPTTWTLNRCRTTLSRNAGSASWPTSSRSQPPGCRPRSAARSRCWSTRSPTKAPSAAATPTPRRLTAWCFWKATRHSAPARSCGRG